MKKYTLHTMTFLLLFMAMSAFFCGCKEQKRVQKLSVTFSGPPGMTMSYKNQPLKGLVRTPYPGSYIFKFNAPGCKPLWQQFDITPADHKSTKKITMEPERSAVFVSCSTDEPGKDGNVSVFLNGSEQGTTPCLITGIPIGTHTLELTHPGHASKNIQIKIDSSRPLPMIKEQLSSNSGMLRVTGKPEGAMLYVDDKLVGPIPFQAKYTAGKYLLELRSPGYITSKQEIILHANRGAKAEIVLNPEPSSLSISSTPGNAVCFIRGEKRGTTPLRVENLQPGNYKVELRLPGYDPVEEMVEVKPGSHEKLNITMETGTGFARLNIRPAGVDVFVDGKLVSRTEAIPGRLNDVKPIFLKNLSPGTHSCAISHPWAKPKTVKRFKFRVYKNRTTECPVVELWVANAEVTYKNNLKDMIKIIRMDNNEVEFSLQPGISVTEKLSNVRIRHLEPR